MVLQCCYSVCLLAGSSFGNFDHKARTEVRSVPTERLTFLGRSTTFHTPVFPVQNIPERPPPEDGKGVRPQQHSVPQELHKQKTGYIAYLVHLHSDNTNQDYVRNDEKEHNSLATMYT